MLDDVVRGSFLFLACLAVAGCAVDKTGLGEPPVDSDAAGIDAGARDLGAPHDLGGSRVDMGGGGVDAGPDDAGCATFACAPPTMCNRTTGDCEVPPDAGCMVNGCTGGALCRGTGICTSCDPTTDGCCPACAGGTTCDTTMHACISSMTCGDVGQPCCVSLNPCPGSHAACDYLGGFQCVHCGRSGEPCCGGGACDGTTCAWGTCM